MAVALAAAIIHLLGSLAGGMSHAHVHDEPVVVAVGHHEAEDDSSDSHDSGDSDDSHTDGHSHGADSSCGFAAGAGTAGVGVGAALADPGGLVVEPLCAQEVERPTRAPNSSPPQLLTELQVIRV